MKRPSQGIYGFAYKRLRDLVHFLRRIKMDVIDFHRMQTNYGFVGDCILRLKEMRHNFQQQSRADHNDLVHESDENKNIYSISSRSNNEDYPKITIITPVSNHETVIEKCIASVLCRNYPNLEYIVVDYGSTDSSIDQIKKYDSRLTYIKSKDSIRKTQAINHGLESATGMIFNWLDPHDQLEPGALFQCAKAFLESRESSAWVGASRRVQPDGHISGIVYPNGMDRELFGINWNGGQFEQASCFLSTRKTREAGGLDSDLAHFYGLDLWVKLLKRGDFFTGEGIWSNTDVSKTPGELKSESAYQELSGIRKRYGFPPSITTDKQKKTKKPQQAHTIPPHIAAGLKDSKFMPDDGNRSSQLRPRLIFISYSLPRYDKAASEFRLYSILQLLLDHHYKIDYIFGSSLTDDAKYLKSLKGDINFIYKPQNLKDYIEIIRQSDPAFVWMAELWRISYVEFVVRLTQEIKSKFPEIKVVADTVDFHFKEFHRKYQLTGDQHDLALANDYLKNEKKLYVEADLVTVVSEDEKRDIQKNIAGISPIEVVPNIHELPDFFRPYEERRNICFTGNFGTAHNADAVHHFLENIFPLILERNPSVEFHVIGYLSENHRKEFKQPNVKVIGGLKDLYKALTYYKLFVCPLTYGAGMKGKVGDAIINGTPVVTSSLGAEGFPAKDGDAFFIADNTAEFAYKCDQCLNDPITWHNLVLKSKLMIAEKFTPRVVALKLNDILSC